MRVAFAKRAMRDIRRLDPRIQKRLLAKLAFYFHHRDPLRFAEKLTDAQIGSYRFRIGDYRVVCDMNGGAIVILRIGHRREIYR